MQDSRPTDDCRSNDRIEPVPITEVKRITCLDPDAGEALGNDPVERVRQLIKDLKRIKSFTFARRLLEFAAENSVFLTHRKDLLWLFQQRALCTYKDNDLPADKRLDDALALLDEGEALYRDETPAPGKLSFLNNTSDQETLGIAGAVYKRKWEIDSQWQQLERSLLYYRKAYAEGPANDFGYTGINAAFVLDLLAYEEEEEARKAGTLSRTAPDRRSEAVDIRNAILNVVAPLTEENETLANTWWFCATLGEAHFGLKQYKEAVEWLRRGQVDGNPAEWEIESTVAQMARLAMIQDREHRKGLELTDDRACTELERAFPTYRHAVRNAFIGKIGLALSGGGFRASLFHIGTLAKLAEMDLLRHVEVISGVSGGSIIAAHYYLELRKLLKEKEDRLPDPSIPDDERNVVMVDDYISIVANIESSFLKGVQRNIRTRIAAEPWTNLRMMFSRYSRTQRAGELYESEIYSRVDDGEGDKPRWLNQLQIAPKKEVDDFNPKLHNWRRSAKVPMLVLNAATLNTGHNWQFTTTWMGEPPSSIDVEVDTNEQLRRMWYTEAPAEHQCVRLGSAVAASAAVPGVFEPLSLYDLYPDRVVRLVDGGVCDNQGVSSLLEQDCNVILVSDGSGQMETKQKPGGVFWRVLLRTNSIFQARIRDAQYHDLERRRRSLLLRGLMFIHLKQGLETESVNWIGNEGRPSPLTEELGSTKDPTTVYGISTKVQQYLAATRTDLDSFTDIEAYALMTSAYKMAEHALTKRGCVDGFTVEKATYPWNFLKIAGALVDAGPGYGYVSMLLRYSSRLFLKVWFQSRPLRALGATIVVAITALSAWLCWVNWQRVVIPAFKLSTILTAIGVALALVVAGWVFGRFFVHIVQFRETLILVVLGLTGFLAAGFHLLVTDRVYLRMGRLDKVLAKEKEHVQTPSSVAAITHDVEDKP